MTGKHAEARVELIRLRARNRQRIDKLLGLVRAEFKAHTNQAQKRLTMIELREATTDERPTEVLAEIRRQAKHLAQLNTWADDQIGALKERQKAAITALDGAIFDEQLDLFAAANTAGDEVERDAITVTLDPSSGEMAIQYADEPAPVAAGGKRGRKA